MAKHTKKNLKHDVENGAAKRGIEGRAMHPAGDALDLRQTGLSYQHMDPGHRNPAGHAHSTKEEVYVVIAGSGRIRIEDEVIDLQPLDAVRVDPDAMRALEAGPDGLEFIAISAQDAEDEPAFDRGWWPSS